MLTNIIYVRKGYVLILLLLSWTGMQASGGIGCVFVVDKSCAYSANFRGSRRCAIPPKNTQSDCLPPERENGAPPAPLRQSVQYDQKISEPKNKDLSAIIQLRWREFCAQSSGISDDEKVDREVEFFSQFGQLYGRRLPITIRFSCMKDYSYQQDDSREKSKGDLVSRFVSMQLNDQ